MLAKTEGKLWSARDNLILLFLFYVLSLIIMNKKNKREVFLILENIRSNFNVGSIFRIADCVGVSKVFLCGYTPAPTDKFGRNNNELKKVALGGDVSVDWEKVFSVSRLVKDLKEKGFQIVSLEQADGSIDYKKFKPKYPVAIVLGNEVSGVSKNTLKNSDIKIEIPMKGKKESLNVSIATAVALFRVMGV